MQFYYYYTITILFIRYFIRYLIHNLIFLLTLRVFTFVFLSLSFFLYIHFSNYISISPKLFEENLDKIEAKLELGVSLSEVQNLERLSQQLDTNELYTLVLGTGLALTFCSCLLTTIFVRYGRRKLPVIPDPCMKLTMCVAWPCN